MKKIFRLERGFFERNIFDLYLFRNMHRSPFSKGYAIHVEKYVSESLLEKATP